MHKLLFVEDNRIILASISAQLAEKGYQIDSVDNLEDAGRMVETKTYDLALLDYWIATNSSLDFAATRLKPNGTPFIFLTAYSDQPTVDACLAIGASSYLAKPFEVHQLVPIIETTLARHADVAEHAKRGDKLERALHDSREISIAVGISMYSHGLSDKDAFARLRDKARSERRKLQELCAEIVSAANNLAKLN
jgi:two-component system, response regulator PdtaR